ncbi:MAG: FAD:protein FMN transferase [Oscillospiraceae bacterium]|jgi:thiamine biosynthesis lipoprotein|nr:FAD:protein FMN transferase [Oscillospiraceae bacterium]
MKFSVKEKMVIAASGFIVIGLIAYYVVNGIGIKMERTPHETSGLFAMGSVISQKLYGSHSEVEMDAVANEAFTAVKELEGLISWQSESSDIGRLNKAEGEAVSFNKKSYELLKQNLAVARKSSGAFDPTILPVVKLWGFDPPHAQDSSFSYHVPKIDDIHSTLALVDYHKVITDDAAQAVRLGAGQSIDLGGSGKGAACDAAVEVYRKNAGISGGMIVVGGSSIGLMGEKPEGKSWDIAIRDPRGTGAGDNLAIIQLKNCFVSTSGDYEKFFAEGSDYYHHIINPRTGWPSKSGIISATVVCSNGALSDMLSTACVVLGKDAALELLKEAAAEAVLADDAKNLYITQGLKSGFSLINESYTINYVQ